jgi:hypothetical protein
MKELEIKQMLADKNIPDCYKWGGKLDSRFLDGVEYAERAFKKNGLDMWASMDEDDDERIYITQEKPKLYEGVWNGNVLFTIDSSVLPSLNFENSPLRVKIILED